MIMSPLSNTSKRSFSEAQPQETALSANKSRDQSPASDRNAKRVCRLTPPPPARLSSSRSPSANRASPQTNGYSPTHATGGFLCSRKGEKLNKYLVFLKVSRV